MPRDLLAFELFSDMMSIDVKAQQVVIDALSMDCRNFRKTVLCNTPSGVRSDAGIFISSQDRLAELFTGEGGSTISIFPNMSFVRRLCKQSSYEKFSVEFVFAVNSYCDPCLLALDIMNKFRTELSFVSKATYLAELPRGTYRQKQAFIAYLVTVTNEQVDSFDLLWSCRSGEAFETLLPKAIVDMPDIKELLREKRGPLSRNSTRKNGCIEVASNGNHLPLTFSSGPKDREKLREAFSDLLFKLREYCEEFPASVIQVKSGINWKATKRIERSILFLQSFDDAQILDLAVHLTQCRVDFHFSTPRSVVLDLDGISSATLIRLFQYAEIPVPTSTTQGAFSVSFMNPGEEGYSNARADRELTKINITWGRLSALNSVPAQIKMSALQNIERFHSEGDEFETWIWDTLKGACPQKVLCFDEENNTDWYMQFHIPTKYEEKLPIKLTLDEEVILVEHARPYAYLQTGSRRPPAEETMHEHWKKAVRLAPSERIDRSNFIAHVENNIASLQRISLLHELPVNHRGVRYIGTCEMSEFPILFINGEVSVNTCMSTLINNIDSLPDLQEELRESYDSYVQDPPIPVVILLPKGIKLEFVCTPSRHIEILAKIPVASLTRQSQLSLTHPTELGVNDANVAELSVALQNSLSIEDDTQLSKPKAGIEMQLNVSCDASADEHEEGKNIKSTVPPAVSGGPEPSVNLSFECHERRREETISPTATWPPNPPSKTGRTYNQTEELTCLTRVVKPIKHDKGEFHDQPIIGLKDPPAIVLDRDDLGRNEDVTKQILQVITESHEENNISTGNLRQDVEVSSSTSLVADGKRINRSITQTLKPNANVSTPKNSSSPDLNVRPSANVIDDKQEDAKCFQPFTAYVSNPATPLESVTAKTGLHSLRGIPLITPLEPDDKEMPKARRSKSIGQFPSTSSKHKGTNGNSKFLPPNRHIGTETWLESLQKEEGTVVVL